MIAVLDASVALKWQFEDEEATGAATALLEDFVEGKIELIEPTFQMARHYRLSPYDCAYMALAEKEKCDLLTGDSRLFNAIMNQLAWVRWIGDYPP